MTLFVNGILAGGFKQPATLCEERSDENMPANIANRNPAASEKNNTPVSDLKKKSALKRFFYLYMQK
ncbi:MAG: hypothetical protein LBF85_08080 [Tannerella sp.]|jgi:hypothetical protein|nr:hypothetical protein [Tannerella sp.]